MVKKKRKTFILIIVLLIIAGGIFWWQKDNISNLFFKESPKACTQEAKLCPDGSYVGRTGPNCEFAPCPEVKDETANWQTYRNEEYGFEIKYPLNYSESKTCRTRIGLCIVSGNISVQFDDMTGYSCSAL